MLYRGVSRLTTRLVCTEEHTAATIRRLTRGQSDAGPNAHPITSWISGSPTSSSAETVIGATKAGAYSNSGTPIMQSAPAGMARPRRNRTSQPDRGACLPRYKRYQIHLDFTELLAQCCLINQSHRLDDRSNRTIRIGPPYRPGTFRCAMANDGVMGWIRVSRLVVAQGLNGRPLDPAGLYGDVVLEPSGLSTALTPDVVENYEQDLYPGRKPWLAFASGIGGHYVYGIATRIVMVTRHNRCFSPKTSAGRGATAPIHNNTWRQH